MKKLVFLLLVVFISLQASTQRVYFLYLQSDNGKPFYTRIDEKVYSSSASGYLIISRLRDTTYKISIGFANGSVAENRYTISINKRDHGYLLKSFGDKGWGLFDLQNMSVTMPVVDRSTSQLRTESLESNHFTDMLARAADDTTLKYKPIMVKVEEKKPVESIVKVDKKEEPKTEAPGKVPIELKKETQIPATTTEEVKKDLPKENKIEPPKNSETIKVEEKIDKKEPVAIVIEPKKVEEKKNLAETNNTKRGVDMQPEEEYKRSRIIRRSESSTTEGFGLVFVDILPGGNTDTIRLIIPNQNKGFGIKEPEIVSKREEKRFIEMSPVDSTQRRPDVKKTGNSNCRETASESDFFKLRKKMASASSDASMLTEAKRTFRVRCFTTQQIKNLSTLFLRDEGKYKFFDGAYSYITDVENFAALQSELKEEYFIDRFKALMK